MGRSIVRSVVSIIASLLVAVVLIVVVEVVSGIFHPFPPGVDPSDYEVCKAHVARYPAWVLAVVAACWGLTVLLSAWLATRLGAGRHPAHGYLVGSLLLLAAIANMLMLPYPLWFELLNVVTFLFGTYWGARLGKMGGTVPLNPDK